LQRPLASLAPLGRLFTAERQGRWPYHSQCLATVKFRIAHWNAIYPCLIDHQLPMATTRAKGRDELQS
jgi:hypothetical protein